MTYTLVFDEHLCREYTTMYRTRDRRNRRRPPPFSEWLEDRVREMCRVGENPSEDLITMSRLPSPVVRHHPSMWAYGYHFRSEDVNGGAYVSFDAGVAAIINQTCRSSRADRHPVEAELLYVGVVEDILRVDYGHLHINVLKCSWVKPHLEGVPTIRRDEDGFWSVKYRSRQPPGVEPYLMPVHARQVRHVNFDGNSRCHVVDVQQRRVPQRVFSAN